MLSKLKKIIESTIEIFGKFAKNENFYSKTDNLTYLCGMKEQDERLSGVMVPDWYLERELELLEALQRLQEAKRAYRTARNKLVAMMKRNGTRRLETDLTTIYLFPAANGKAKRLRVVLK